MIFSKFFNCFNKNNILNSIESKLNDDESEKVNKLNHIEINHNEYKKFDLENIEGEYYVDSVYDGDTITLLIPIKLHIYSMNNKINIKLDSDSNSTNTIYMYQVKLRLIGIDTPEIKPSKNIPNREEHIKKAIQSKKFLSELILNKIVKIKFIQNDKYGRSLGNVYINNICVNDLMIEKGYAKKYNGGYKDLNF